MQTQSELRVVLWSLLANRVIDAGRYVYADGSLSPRGVVVGLRAEFDPHKFYGWSVQVRNDGDARDYSYSTGLSSFLTNDQINSIFGERQVFD